MKTKTKYSNKTTSQPHLHTSSENCICNNQVDEILRELAGDSSNSPCPEMLLLPNEVLTLRNISRILEAYGWGSGAAPEGLDSIEFRIAGAGAGKLPVELRRYPWGFRFRSEWRLMADEALQAKLALVNDLSNSVPGAAFVYRGTPVDPEHHEKPVPGLCHGICYLPAAAGVTWLQFTIALMRTVSSTTHAAQIARDRGLLDEEQWPDGFIFKSEQS